MRIEISNSVFPHGVVSTIIEGTIWGMGVHLTLLRNAAARSVEDLWRIIAGPLDEFSPQESRSFFRRAGSDRDQS